ncbi:MAG: sulfite exporter TauE/SafE family protein, partial [Deltaproteobacteria bacterium]
MALTLFQIVAIAVLILLAALIKTGFGVGGGVFLSATLCLVIPPKMAIAIGGPVMFLTDILPVYHYRKEICKPILFLLMFGSLSGILIGGLIINSIPDRWFVKIVGIFCGLFAAQQLIQVYTARMRPGNGDLSSPSRPLPRWIGFLIGLLGGMVSAISHAGGLVYSVYMLRLRMAKSAFVGTIVAVFFLSDLLKIGVYWKMELLPPPMLLLVGWMIPVVIIGSFLGYLLHKSI